MKTLFQGPLVTVELTRRNLLSLLAKLDGNPPDSYCAITKGNVIVKAVEDAEHYDDHEAGEMHPATEAVL